MEKKDNIYAVEKPIGILEAQVEVNKAQKTQNMHQEFGYLFYSFDIVNSTMYKTYTEHWITIMSEILDNVRKEVITNEDIAYSSLWRVLGDELVFYMPIYNGKEGIIQAVDSIFEITTIVSRNLENGKIIRLIENLNLEDSTISYLCLHNPLSIRTTAWCAAVSEDPSGSNVKNRYDESGIHDQLIDFMGPEIDAGFRIKDYSQAHRMVISYELANILAHGERKDNLHIMKYVQLKGIWNGALYPIIWYHNEEIVRRAAELEDENDCSFKRSFRYDEAFGNDLVANYLKRNDDGAAFSFENVDSKMYEICDALDVIAKDRKLGPKMEQLMEAIERKPINQGLSKDGPLTLHIAVICCDVANRKVMICKRAKGRKREPSKWDFGCAKASSTERIVDTVERYYHESYGVSIKVLTDNSRAEQQPRPLAIYEIQGERSVKKGVIIVARLCSEEHDFRKNKKYEAVKWIAEQEIDKYEGDAVSDFGNSLRSVFNCWDTFFKEDN